MPFVNYGPEQGGIIDLPGECQWARGRHKLARLFGIVNHDYVRQSVTQGRV